MELREFLRLPEAFDFKELMGEYYIAYADRHKSEDEYKHLLEELSKMHTKDNIRKWYLYKTLDKGLKESIKRFDCDSWNKTCELIDQIYRTLWKNKSEFTEFGGDTINSFAYTFNSWSEKKSFEDSYEKYEGSKESRKKANEQKLEELARNVGCLGNFTLVPPKFNGYRSRLDDYFDLSLKELKEATEMNWLGEKVNFSQYVNIFFLWDYTEVDEDQKEYKVKLFFEGHSKENKSPEEDGEFERCFSTMNNNILERGKFMVDMLRIAEKDQKAYECIQEYLYNLSEEDIFFKSIEDAREHLKEKGYFLDD